MNEIETSKSTLGPVGIVGLIAGGIGIIGGIMNILQIKDQMQNGIKLRNDQLDYISDRVSVQVAPAVTNNMIQYWNQCYAELEKLKEEDSLATK